MSSDREKWNDIYADAPRTATLPTPCEVLDRYAYFLPASGAALDVACGRGGNALLLAKKGLSTTAVDISDNVIATLGDTARDHRIKLNAVASPIEEWLSMLDAAVCFDVIVVSRFLDRTLIPALLDRLHHRGLIYYQTFVKDKVAASAGPSRADFLLQTNELLTFFAGLNIRVFYDPGTVGNPDLGLRNESYVVAQKMVRE